MGTFNNNHVATGNSSKKYLDANNNQNVDAQNLGTTFGAIFGGPIGAAVGSLGGAGINYLMNSSLQDKQFENQKELQDRAFKMNEQAVQRQAQNQVIGMQNAGLNPAAVNGAGAPSIQAGAAAGGTSQLANIFTGVAELIAAAKAPTEIEKMVAETGKTKAETGLTEAQTTKTETEIPSIIANTEKIKQETNKLFEDTINAKNANAVWESTNNFYKSYAPTMFDEYKTKLEKAGVWESLSPRTKDTIEGLIDGSIEMDMGSIIALSQLISSQKQISDTDKAMLQNALEGTILSKQLNDKNVIDALTKIPENELKSMQENWKSQRSTRLTQAEQRKLIKEQATGKNIENLQKELDDFNYLVSKGRYKEAALQLLRNTGRTAQKAVPAVAGAVAGGIIGGPAGAVAGGAVGTAQGLTGNDYGL